jgi:hypothetical protein
MQVQDWDELCDQYMMARGWPECATVTATIGASLPPISHEWFKTALQNGHKKWFVSWVFRTWLTVPGELFDGMIRAAVYEVNPSTNDQFIQPCLRAFGVIAVNEALLTYLAEGSNFEKAGAVNALYWAQRMGESGIPEVDISSIRDRKREMFLREFISNEDTNVRRSIIPSLNLDELVYPDELKPLVQQAILIARAQPDDYIRHRVEVQLGNERLFRPLPPRSA